MKALWVALLVSLALPHANATPIRLDDSGSHTIPAQVQMQWRHVPGTSLTSPGALSNQMEAALRVAIQLETQAYAGRSGRVYMVLPADGGARLALQWQTQGRLMAGRLAPGERTLVYQGALPELPLTDQLQLQVLADGEWAQASRRLSIHFELEL